MKHSRGAQALVCVISSSVMARLLALLASLLAARQPVWAEVVNFGHRFVHIPDTFVRRYERLLEGGV